MLFERIESQDLAHYSYLVEDQKEATVIDPRRDCAIYIGTATQAGLRIAHILKVDK